MKHNSKVDCVYQYIRDGIQKGVFLPGERLVISRIAKENECSEIPVREALRRLESEKIVNLIPYKGAVVSQVNKGYMQQLFQVKCILEGQAVRLATDSITGAQLKNLRGLAQEMRDLLETGNLKRCAALNRKFHLTLYKATGNDVLVQCISDLWNKWPLGYYANQIPDEWYRISTQQHFDLLDAIEAGDKDKAQSIILMHKQGSLANLGKRPERQSILE